MRLLAAFLGLLAASPAAAFEHSLRAGGLARFHAGSQGKGSGQILILREAALSDLPDPRCPATSALTLTWSATSAATLPLPCDGWQLENGRYVFVDRTGKAAGVRRLVAGGGALFARLSGAAANAPDGARFVEVKLTVGGDDFCARFSGFRSSTASSQLLARGRSDACRLPRPSFIVINLDDVRFDGLGEMPIAQEEIVGRAAAFTNSFVPDSVCCPSRASILTGLYALRHGTRHVAGPIGGAHTFRESGADQQTIAVWLHQAGYRTGLFGKYLNAYDDSTEGGLGPGGTFYVPPGWDRWWAFESPEHYGGFLGTDYTVVREDGEKTLYTDHSTDAEYSTFVSSGLMRDFIAESVNGGAPFFAYWAPYAAHGDAPNLLPVPAAQDVDAFAGIPLWRPPSWNEMDVSDKPRAVQSARAFVDDPSGAGPFLPPIGDAIRQRQYETLLSVDEEIGKLLEQLTSLGIEDDTVIFLTSDNGLAWGEHVTFGGKESPYEESARVPLYVRYPRRVAHQVIDATALNIDVAPTLAAYADIEPGTVTDGASIDGWLAGTPPRGWRGDFLMERWRSDRSARLTYKGQVADGDRLGLFYGEPTAVPRPYEVFEFDAGDGVSDGAVAVPIAADAAGSISNLVVAVTRAIPRLLPFHNRSTATLAFSSRDDKTVSLYFWKEVDQHGVLDTDDPLPEYFGVRDVAGGYTWIEYETGERELYDLNVDPDELQSRHADPAYASVRSTLQARLAALIAEISARGKLY